MSDKNFKVEDYNTTLNIMLEILNSSIDDMNTEKGEE